MFIDFVKKLQRGFKRDLDKNEISKDELRDYINEGAIIVDVRSPQEYEEGHIYEAILIPEYDIKREAEKVLKDKGELIVVYCSSGSRSKKAQKELQKMGYLNVYNLKEGYIF